MQSVCPGYSQCRSLLYDLVSDLFEAEVKFIATKKADDGVTRKDHLFAFVAYRPIHLSQWYLSHN